MAKKPVKKGMTAVRLSGNTKAIADGEIPDFKTAFKEWKTKASTYSLSMGKGDITILQFIENMGRVGRHAPEKDGELRGARAPPQKFIQLAEEVSKEKALTGSQLAKIKQLQAYLTANKSDTSKNNPANIKFNGIAGFSSKGKITKKPMYGDYRTKQYVRYRKKFKNQTVEPAKEHWYNEKPGTARPPVWQALFGEEIEDFKSPSLLKISTDLFKALEGLDFEIDPNEPYRLTASKAQGTAEFLYTNISAVRQLFEKLAKDPAFSTNKGFRQEKAQNLINGKNTGKPFPFIISPAESKAFLSEIGEKDSAIELDKIYLHIPKRQCGYLAAKAGYKVPVQETPKIEKSWKKILEVVR